MKPHDERLIEVLAGWADARAGKTSTATLHAIATNTALDSGAPLPIDASNDFGESALARALEALVLFEKGEHENALSLVAEDVLHSSLPNSNVATMRLLIQRQEVPQRIANSCNPIVKKRVYFRKNE
jgi:hypothetical protein